jgi:hypothetical protein
VPIRTKILVTIAGLWLAALVAVTAQTIATAEHHRARRGNLCPPSALPGCISIRSRPASTEIDLAHAVSLAVIITGAGILSAGITLIWTRRPEQAPA